MKELYSDSICCVRSEYLSFAYLLQGIASFKDDLDRHFVEHLPSRFWILTNVHESLYTANLSISVCPFVDSWSDFLYGAPVNENLFLWFTCEVSEF